MSGYIGVVPLPQATQTRDVFTATSGQTTFATSGYTPNFLDVWLNGVKLVNGDDFTATNGSDVVLTSGATAGDTVEVLSYSTYEVNAQTYTGGLTVNNDAATVLTVDRATSEGSIVDLKKDGATVGSVGTYASFPYLASTTNSLLLSTKVMPATNTGDVADGVMDLGQSDRRFKDLYLSGGVYLGGTGAANLLDDYEEGTWTPVIRGTGSNPSVTYNTSNTGGLYTKIGNTVWVSFEVRWSAISGGSGFAFISGLPFARKTTQLPDGDRAVFDHYNVTVPSGGLTPIVSVGANLSQLGLSFTRSGTSTTELPVGNLLNANPGFIRGTITYTTA